MKISTKEYDRLIAIVNEAQKILNGKIHSKPKALIQLSLSRPYVSNKPKDKTANEKIIWTNTAGRYLINKGEVILKETKNNVWFSDSQGYVIHLVRSKNGAWNGTWVIDKSRGSDSYKCSIVNGTKGEKLWKAERSKYPYSKYNVCRKYRGGLYGHSRPTDATHYDVYVYRRSKY